VIYCASVHLQRELNRLAFLIMGDMIWHTHDGITTLPVRVAPQSKVALLI